MNVGRNMIVAPEEKRRRNVIFGQISISLTKHKD